MTSVAGLHTPGTLDPGPLPERRAAPRRCVVSVVIPCYNAAAHLADALASVEAQRRPADEVIFVDDGSTDDSVAMARAAGARCLATAGRCGPSAARNAGIRAARGDVLAFLDADDVWTPDHLECVIGLLERFPQAGVAFGREQRIGLWAGESPPSLPAEQPVDAFWPCLAGNPVPQMGVAVRRALLLALEGYDESLRYAEDYDLWLRLAQLTPFVCTHAITSLHRGHNAQASRDPERIGRGAIEARHRLWQAAEQWDPPTRERMSAVLQAGWEQYLSECWRARDQDRFDGALALGNCVPDSEEIHRRWVRRRPLLPLYRALTRLWDRLPSGTRAGMRRPLRRLWRLA